MNFNYHKLTDYINEGFGTLRIHSTGLHLSEKDNDAVTQYSEHYVKHIDYIVNPTVLHKSSRVVFKSTYMLAEIMKRDNLV